MMFYSRPLLLPITIVATWIMHSMMAIPGHAASAQLSWMAPTKSADGSPLNDLAGYKVYYGLASRTYGAPIPIPNSTVTTHTLLGLTDGVQYFIAVKAYDTSGNESAFSDEVTFPKNVLAASFTATPTSGPAHDNPYLYQPSYVQRDAHGLCWQPLEYGHETYYRSATTHRFSRIGGRL